MFTTAEIGLLGLRAEVRSQSTDARLFLMKVHTVPFCLFTPKVYGERSFFKDTSSLSFSFYENKSQHLCLYGLHISWNSFRKLHEATNQEKLGRWLSVHKFYLLNFVVNDYVCNSVMSSLSLYLSHSIW